MDGTHWMYVLLVLVTMPPMIPNSALVAGAGALAAAGSLNLPLLIVILLASTVLGDMSMFWTGCLARGRALRWMSRRQKRRSMLDWAAERFRRYGVPSVIAMRFVPSGRGLGGVTAGIVDFPLRSYLLGALAAEAVFVSCTLGLGYLGGRLVDNTVMVVCMGPAVSVLTASTVMGVRWAWTRWNPRPASDRGD
ncbi:DedA family protein [Streptomyces sp. NRRL S-1022]|uniref:DedA family protein n=1 Tax=Streptomyces sp. NRRL S-1022 TaxID=1463880 RepID=UPI00068A9324|nr:VTT domain-containing protein [Streptomyces sp. NRRL S-1022]